MRSITSTILISLLVLAGLSIPKPVFARPYLDYQVQQERTTWYYGEVTAVHPEDNYLTIHLVDDGSSYKVFTSSPNILARDLNNNYIPFTDFSVGDKLFLRSFFNEDHILRATKIEQITEQAYTENSGTPILGTERFDKYYDTESPLAYSKKQFPDIPYNHPYSMAIDYLRYNGFVRGYRDGLFRPDQLITRSESLKFILFANGVGVNPDNTATSFKDIRPYKWYSPFVKVATSLGLIHGFADGTFRPDAFLKRDEALKILFRAKKIVVPGRVDLAPYIDVGTDEWQAPYFTIAKQRNIIPASDSDYIYPKNAITRGELAEILYRLIVLERTNTFHYRQGLIPDTRDGQTSSQPVALAKSKKPDTNIYAVDMPPVPSIDVAEANITVQRYKYSPSTLYFKPGRIIRLHVHSLDIDHGFFIPDLGIAEKIPAGKDVVIEFMANDPGKYTFSCGTFCPKITTDNPDIATDSEMRGTIFIK